MAIPRLFWTSLSISILIAAASVAYFLLVYTPLRDARRDQAAAESARHAADRARVLGCASQAEVSASKLGREMSGLGERIVGSTNHFNSRLERCFVEIQTVFPGGGLGFSVVDAYENSVALSCWTTPRTKGIWDRTCIDNGKKIDAEKADAREEDLMTH